MNVLNLSVVTQKEVELQTPFWPQVQTLSHGIPQPLREADFLAKGNPCPRTCYVGSSCI